MFPYPIWTLEVDWDDDGTYDAVNEAVNLVGLKVRRGRDFFIKADGKGFERFAVGTATLTLKNLDGRYGALNAASPLYPNVKPGRYARIQVHDGTTLRKVFTGRIADIRPTGDVLNPQVQMILEDGWTWLKERAARVAVQENIGTATAIGMVLDDADWPALWGDDLSGSADTIPYWWADQRQADEEIQDLADSELGLFTIAADGKARFRGRHTIDDVVLTVHQADVEREVGLPQPWEAVRGKVRLFVHPRTRQATSELWRLQDKPFVPAGESLTLFAPFSYNNQEVPALGVVPPPLPAPFCGGGTVTTVGGKRIHTFTSSGTLVVLSPGNVEVLVIAGGGGGGKAESNPAGDGGGGGGAGGRVYSASLAVTAGSKTVTIGAGGAGSTAAASKGANGGNSVFDSQTAIGGGGGGSDNGGAANTGADGGCGGGAASRHDAATSGGTGSQGFNGGNCDADINHRGGAGGGGIGAVGADQPASHVGGAGGAGTSYSISGTAVTYGGGGGGGGCATTGGAGGAGGGGAGGNSAGNGTAGTANLGGGGGGGGSNGGNGGNGGSGIVIVSYAYDPTTMDYLMNSASDGSGTDLTADFTVVATVFGMTVELVVTNGGSVGGYITLLRVHGDALTALSPAILEAVAAADVRSVFEHDLPWQQNTNTGQDLVNLMASLLSGSQLYPMVSLVGQPHQQFAADLLDRIRLVLPGYGVDDEYRLGMIEHEWLDRAGMVVRTTWRSEFAIALLDYWMFPTLLGVTSDFGV